LTEGQSLTIGAEGFTFFTETRRRQKKARKIIDGRYPDPPYFYNQKPPVAVEC